MICEIHQLLNSNFNFSFFSYYLLTTTKYSLFTKILNVPTIIGDLINNFSKFLNNSWQIKLMLSAPFYILGLTENHLRNIF